MHSRLWLAIAASASIALASSCGSAGHDATPAPDPFVDTDLDEFGIALLPTPDDLTRVAETYPDRPVVMVNLLHFRERAIGLDQDSSGEDAYQIYANGVLRVVREIGGRVLWAGRVDAQVVGSSEPRFDEIALVEYPNGAAFFSLATDPRTLEILSYRTAGLEGQWLLASSTEIEPPGPFGGPPDSQAPSGDVSRADLETLSRATGLSTDQLERLLDGPANEPVDIVELLRFDDEGAGREEYERYAASLDRVAVARGARVRWQGAGDFLVFGVGSPLFDRIVVTRYPSRQAYIDVLADPTVAEASQLRSGALEAHWIYATSEEAGFEVGME